ncbi:enoyl-CoA hydratase-related protein [Lutimaribacter sp. EGI FJ00013]|uniref:Enoyl-CoA hydratase-related protein n=2 Tax=Lutimaribacter degradans TaxID=2945989 RepID=A0ACC5ZUN6_9RHOB|nr:enoyl-CoA hydratase-related protein [Lutimaribacter sp. EGI FJ00013]
MNAFDTAMAEEMLALFGTTLRRRDDIRAVVLTGAGDRAFCVGADLKERAGMTNDAWRKQHALYRDTFESLWNFPWPIIAAIRGYALGGGCELALAADFVHAADDAVFGLPEINLGIMPGAGGTQLLSRAVGLRRAKELILTGKKFSAHEARDWGLVNAIHPAGEELEAAVAVAQRIAGNAPLAVQGAKRAMDGGIGAPLKVGLALEVSVHQRLSASEDRAEGVDAFNEKRTPQWKFR